MKSCRTPIRSPQDRLLGQPRPDHAARFIGRDDGADKLFLRKLASEQEEVTICRNPTMANETDHVYRAHRGIRQELEDRAREEEMDILTKLGLREDGTPLYRSVI